MSKTEKDICGRNIAIDNHVTVLYNQGVNVEFIFKIIRRKVLKLIIQLLVEK